jgi:hypothetical protein
LSLGSRLKIQSKGILAASVFYTIVGVIFLVYMFIANFPPHLAIIGLFSLVAAYGLLMRRPWAIWFVIILFFTGTTFSVFMIYDVLTRNYILGIIMIAYLILTWIFTAYIVSRRKTIEN